MPQKASFEQWMKEVDNAVCSLTGISVHDMSDFMFRDRYDDGAPAEEVAEEILEKEGFFDMFG